MKISVIIAYYKNLPFLKLVLEGFIQQTSQEFELVVAEDDNASETAVFLKGYQSKLSIKHVTQADEGFRKCAALNSAIKVASTNYLVFIDGDCVPHKRFVESYIKLTKLNCCFGRRVMLSKSHTDKLIKNSSGHNLLSLILNGSKQLKHSFYLPFRKPSTPKNKGIWGCNWGVKKEHLVALNGFDEDYVLAGIGEDVDIEWRLRKAGIKIWYVKHLPIVYHLHHKEHYNDKVVQKNKMLLENKKKVGIFRCLNGLHN